MRAFRALTAAAPRVGARVASASRHGTASSSLRTFATKKAAASQQSVTEEVNRVLARYGIAGPDSRALSSAEVRQIVADLMAAGRRARRTGRRARNNGGRRCDGAQTKQRRVRRGD
jgi:hypothetical protein